MTASRFAFVLKARRMEKGLTQRQLADKAGNGLTDKDISAYERGERYPVASRKKALEEHLGPLPDGRRCKVASHNKRWRSRFRDRKLWRPRKDRDYSTRLKAALAEYPKHMATLEHIVEARKHWLAAAVHGSSLELLFTLLLFAFPNAVELSVRPISWGFRRLAVHDQVSGECRSDHSFPALGLAWDDCEVVVVPQVPLRTKNGKIIVIDNLVCVRIGRTRIWFALEIDGPGHRSYADELRAQHLEVLRFTQAQILSATFEVDFKRRVRGMVSLPVAA